MTIIISGNEQQLEKVKQCSLCSFIVLPDWLDARLFDKFHLCTIYIWMDDQCNSKFKVAQFLEKIFIHKLEN